MKIVFAADLHGSRKLYGQLFSYALQENARCILLGGDLLPTRLDAPWKLLNGRADFSRALSVQLEFIDSFLAPALDGFTALHPDTRVLYVPGNHDWQQAVEHLVLAAPRALCIHGRTESQGGLSFTGYGCTTDSPFWVKDFVRRDLPHSGYVESRYPLVSTPDGVSPCPDGLYAIGRPSIEEELSELGNAPGKESIFVTHCPPYASGLDTLYTGRPIGSKAIAEFIRRQTPLVSLHGHIHEAPRMSGFFHCGLGRTLSVNPGHHPAELHAVAFDSQDPAGSLVHRVFGTGPAGTTGAVERHARAIKSFIMRKALSK
jgi:Icc-related predicted phosphoesterase